MILYQQNNDGRTKALTQRKQKHVKMKELENRLKGRLIISLVKPGSQQFDF